MYSDPVESCYDVDTDAQADIVIYDGTRCRQHGTQLSSPCGMFDAPCDACEAEAADGQDEYEFSQLPVEEQTAMQRRWALDDARRIQEKLDDEAACAAWLVNADTSDYIPF